MELFKWVIRAVEIKVFKEILSYIKQYVHEPLFWVILIIIIALGIIGIIQERREKKSERKRAPKETEGKIICHYCNGYGELMDKGKGREEGTIYPHCSGTGWITR